MPPIPSIIKRQCTGAARYLILAVGRIVVGSMPKFVVCCSKSRNACRSWAIELATWKYSNQIVLLMPTAWLLSKNVLNSLSKSRSCCGNVNRLRLLHNTVVKYIKPNHISSRAVLENVHHRQLASRLYQCKWLNMIILYTWLHLLASQLPQRYAIIHRYISVHTSLTIDINIQVQGVCDYYLIIRLAAECLRSEPLI